MAIQLSAVDPMASTQFSPSQLAELDQPQVLLEEPEPHTRLGQQVRRLEQKGLYKSARYVKTCGRLGKKWVYACGRTYLGKIIRAHLRFCCSWCDQHVATRLFEEHRAYRERLQPSGTLHLVTARSTHFPLSSDGSRDFEEAFVTAVRQWLKADKDWGSKSYTHYLDGELVIKGIIALPPGTTLPSNDAGKLNPDAVELVGTHPSHVTLITNGEPCEISWSAIRRMMDRRFRKRFAAAEIEDRYVAGGRLAALRRKKGLTAREVAKATGMSPQSLSRIERGRHDLVWLHRAILGAIGSSMEEFVAEAIEADSDEGSADSPDSSPSGEGDTGVELGESSSLGLPDLLAHTNSYSINPPESEVAFEKLCWLCSSVTGLVRDLSDLGRKAKTSSVSISSTLGAKPDVWGTMQVEGTLEIPQSRRNT